MKTFTAFVAGTIFGPAALIAWSLWHVGPEKRAEIKKSWKAAWNSGVEKAKLETPPADDKISDEL